MKNKEGMYMVETIISGDVKERRKTKLYRRPVKRGGRIRGNSSEKKIMGNREHAILRLAREFNCNLTPGDLWLTATFSDEALAKVGESYEAAKKEGKKFLDRMVYRLKKMGIVCRWWLIPSVMDGDTGEVVRPHVHIVLTGDGFRMQNKKMYLGDELLTDIWGHGTVDVKFIRNQQDYYPLAAYIVKQARGTADEKKWTCSRNLKKPIVRREIVTSGGQLRVPSGAIELPGTKYDPEKNQNFVRYIPQKKDPRKKIGGRKEMAIAMADDGGGGDDGF